MVGKPRVRPCLDSQNGSASSYKSPRIQRSDQQRSGGSALRLDEPDTRTAHAASHVVADTINGERGPKSEGLVPSDRVNSILQIVNDCSDFERIRSILQLVGNCSDLERTQRILQIMRACSDAERSHIQAVIGGIGSSHNRTSGLETANVTRPLPHNDDILNLPARPKSRSTGKTRINSFTKSIPRKRKGYEEDETDDAIGDEPARQPIQPRTSFRIDDEHMIESFVYTRFLQIQQSALKIMAKTWIKAICPKKQANFPYVDCNPRNDQHRRKPRHDGPPRVPTFWPSLQVCRHREPDHLDKIERTYLMVHLVRLYWGQADWQQANGGNCPVPIPVRVGNWVQFLEEIYPPDKLAEVSASSPEQTKQRVQYLRDIYKVTQAEQEYREGAMDASTTFTFAGDFKLSHPSDVRPRKARQSAASGSQKPGPASDLATSSSATTPTNTGSTTSRRASVDSHASERPQHAPDPIPVEYDMELKEDDDSLIAMASGPARSEGKAPSEPWIMSDEDIQVDGLVGHGRKPAHRSFKIEPELEHPRPTNRGICDGSSTRYGDTNTPHNHATMWGGVLSPSMDVCADPRTSFPGELMPLAGRPGMTYQQDLGTFDHIEGGRALCHPKLGIVTYDQEHNDLYGSLYRVAQPISRTDGPAHSRTNQELMMTSEQMLGGLSGMEPQQSRFNFGGQPGPGQELFSDVSFAMPMARDGQEYIDEAAPLSLFQSF